jgi:hypothetical protein
VDATDHKYDISIPKAWGKLVGFSNNNLLLESSDGMLRIVDVEGKGGVPQGQGAGALE